MSVATNFSILAVTAIDSGIQGFQFLVKVEYPGGDTDFVPVSGRQLVDFTEFQTVALEKTGRLLRFAGEADAAQLRLQWIGQIEAAPWERTQLGGVHSLSFPASGGLGGEMGAPDAGGGFRLRSE